MVQAENSFAAMGAKVNELEGKLKAERAYERKSILENKAVQGLEPLSESKGYRMWNRKLKNVLEQSRRSARKLLMWLDTVTEQAVQDEFDAVHDPSDGKVEAILALWKEYIGSQKDQSITKEEFYDMNRDLWALLVDKAKGEAWNKLNAAGDGEGMWGYVRIHQWFSKTTQQGKVVNRVKVMQPEAPKE